MPAARLAATHAALTARWQRQPDAARAYDAALTQLTSGCAAAQTLSARLMAETGIRLADIVDHLVLADAALLERLQAAGWQRERADEGEVYRNPAGWFPPVTVGAGNAIMLRVESADQFARVHALADAIAGEPFARLRTARVAVGEGTALGIVERNGGTGFVVEPTAAASLRAGRFHLNAFRARRREFDTVAAGLAAVEALVDAAVSALGPHRACAFWLMAEREYWLRRCAAGREQKARQDALGVGFANIDHHTYDSSREHYRHTIRILEKLGYERREMLYAGELAGWGSQVLEQPVIGSTIFADVDLAPDELTLDFAREPLPALARHRRAGLLCELLGESMLEAGLNHVAGLYDQRVLRAQLADRGIGMMAPFTDWPHLYQELTLGDWGAVDPARVDRLEAAGHIGADEAEKLRMEGSIYTHFENIERNEGYKGFNRGGIDDVLRKLDPRAYLATAAD